jgi:hypothetical protein
LLRIEITFQSPLLCLRSARIKTSGISNTRQSPGDIQTIEQKIAEEVVRRLGLNITAEAGTLSQKGGTHDSEASRLYLRGNYFWNQRTKEGLEKGVDYFQQAIVRDPNYALAYCGLANSYNLLGAYGFITPNESSVGLRSPR